MFLNVKKIKAYTKQFRDQSNQEGITLACEIDADTSIEWDRGPISKSKPTKDGYAKEPKIALLPSPTIPPQRRLRKPPSGQALERRRQQNRAAQFAFRQRSKKQIEELRHEIIQYSEHNQTMLSCMRKLLNQTDSLKKDLEVGTVQYIFA